MPLEPESVRPVIRDYHVKPVLPWTILRLLRRRDRTREEIREKLSAMYLGHWPVNDQLLDAVLEGLVREGHVRQNGTFNLTGDGLRALEREEQRIGEHLERGLSKDACAKYSLLGNVGLSLLEFAVGFLSGSIGLIADAIHTAIDIIASALTWIGIRVGREAEAALAGGVILCGIGLFIAWESIGKILEPAPIRFGFIALVTIGINILVNAFFSYYKFYVGGRTRSISLVADAYHTKTDIWSSVAVLVGIAGSLAGFIALDGIAGAAVSFFIILGGYELVKESHQVMAGKDPEMEKFSAFLERHLAALPDRALLVSLWLLNVEPGTWEETKTSLKRTIGRRYPVSLTDEDYTRIIDRIREDHLAEEKDGLLILTPDGSETLSRLAGRQAAYIPLGGRGFLSPRLIAWYTEGL
ncbi:MAG: cation diffusion facilitator family transporter [Methanoregulaceae archaeon]|nr:cation diffusion facilitator family transporter [Methanoregulaceae archaeon]